MKAYIRVYEDIRKRIIRRDYVYGTKIPSKRECAAAFEVSLITVEHAYDLLKEEGYIASRERSGYIVVYKEKDFLSVSSYSVPEVHDVKTEDSEEIPYTVLAKAMRKVLSMYGNEILIRTEGQGSIVLREALCAYLSASRGIDVSAQQIVIGAGSEYMYSLIVTLLGRSRIYGIEDPSYRKIGSMYREQGVRLDYLKMQENGIATEELERTPASVLHVTPFSSFPSGITADAGKRREYILWAQEKDAYIVEDDYASEYSTGTKREDTLFALEPNQRVLYLNSFTKTLSASMRVSYMVLPKEKIEDFHRIIGERNCTVSTFEQYVIAELIRSGEFERHLNKVRRRRKEKAR